MFVFVSTCQFNLMQKLFNGSILMDSHFCLMSRMGLILMKHNPWCIKSNFFLAVFIWYSRNFHYHTIFCTILIRNCSHIKFICRIVNYCSYKIYSTYPFSFPLQIFESLQIWNEHKKHLITPSLLSNHDKLSFLIHFRVLKQTLL